MVPPTLTEAQSPLLLHEDRVENILLLSPDESVLNVSCSSCSDLSAVEHSLVEAERKIAKLLKVKEKLVAIEVSYDTVNMCYGIARPRAQKN